MNTKTKTILIRTIGALVASTFTFAVAAGPADAAPTQSKSGVTLLKADTGW